MALVYQVGHLRHRYAQSIRTDRYRLADSVLFRAATSGRSHQANAASDGKGRSKMLRGHPVTESVALCVRSLNKVHLDATLAEVPCFENGCSWHHPVLGAA